MIHSLIVILYLLVDSLFYQQYSVSQQGHSQPRGETRLDGTRDKKQVWRPHVRTWGLSEANVLYWRQYFWNCCDFLVPHSDSGPRKLCPLFPLVAHLLQTKKVKRVPLRLTVQSVKILLAISEIQNVLILWRLDECSFSGWVSAIEECFAFVTFWWLKKLI